MKTSNVIATAASARRSTPGAGQAMVAALAVALLSSGCGREEVKPAAVPATISSPAPAAPLASATPGTVYSTIYLTERLRSVCALTKIESTKNAPKFAFDEQAILPADRDVLDQVAKCLTTGPLKGRSAKLTGRADPRGASSYNMALGERRANSVVQYLAALGVPPAQMTDTSRGALDATGDDPASWQQDRRVDIDVLDDR